MYINPRRSFLYRLTAVAALLARPGNALADPVASDDARLDTGYRDYGALRGYVARPKNAAEKLPAVLVLHEQRGLNAHTEEVGRRTALGGFTAVVPADATMERLIILVNELASTAKVGYIGFGDMASQLATRSDKFAAAAIFYGEVPDVLDVPRIKARLLLHYAERDPRINTAVPAYEGALKAAGVQHAIHIYPGTERGIDDHTAGARYNKEAAELAWDRTMTFLKDALR